MKVLFIGGTGNISTRVSRLAIERGIELYHLNRGQTRANIKGVRSIRANIFDEAETAKALEGHEWDSVVNWISFTPEHIERDLRLFTGKTRQYVFISSASAYQKPLAYPVITESTPLENPFWQYSRNKIACENTLLDAYRRHGFPGVIVRPSHTYDINWPFALGPDQDWTIPDRMQRGAPILVHGDGTSLWTLTHSADFAKGFVPLLGHPQALGNAYHVTSDERLTWDQIHTIVAEAVGGEPNFVHVPSRLLEAAGWSDGGLIGDKAWSVQFDNTKIKTIAPDFEATIPFHLGVQELVSQYEDPEKRTINDDFNARADAFIAKWQSFAGAFGKTE